MTNIWYEVFYTNSLPYKRKNLTASTVSILPTSRQQVVFALLVDIIRHVATLLERV